MFLDGVHLPQSKDKVYFFQEHSAIENIKYIIVLGLTKMYSIFLGATTGSSLLTTQDEIIPLEVRNIKGKELATPFQ